MLSEKQTKEGWREVAIPDCYHPPESQSDRSKRAAVRVQMESAKRTQRVHCGCGRGLALHHAYKCLYCGEWYCATCAEIHFGETRKDWQARKQS